MSTEVKRPFVFIHIPKAVRMSFLKTLEQLAFSLVTIRFQEFTWLYRSGTWPNDILSHYALSPGHIPYFNIRNESDGRQNKYDLGRYEVALARFPQRCRASNDKVK